MWASWGLQVYANRLNFYCTEICYVHNRKSVILQDRSQRKGRKPNPEALQKSFDCVSVFHWVSALGFYWKRWYCFLLPGISLLFLIIFILFYNLVSHFLNFSPHVSQSHNQLLWRTVRNHPNMTVHISHSLAPFSSRSWCSGDSWSLPGPVLHYARTSPCIASGRNPPCLQLFVLLWHILMQFLGKVVFETERLYKSEMLFWRHSICRSVWLMVLLPQTLLIVRSLS